jgi:hypothetical protein
VGETRNARRNCEIMDLIQPMAVGFCAHSGEPLAFLKAENFLIKMSTISVNISENRLNFCVISVFL